MSEADATRNVNMLRVFSLIMSFLALIGWSTFAYAAKSSATAQQRLSEQVAELKISQGQLIAERDQARAELADLTASRDQFMAERDEAKAQLAAARDEIAMLQKRLDEAQAKVLETGSVRAPTPSNKPARTATQTKKPRR